MSPEDRSPEALRAEIEETREELGETVADLAAKTDVKGQAQAKVDDVKDQAKAKVDEVKAGASATAQEAKTKASEPRNQRLLAIAGAAIGALVLWRLLRSS